MPGYNEIGELKKISKDSLQREFLSIGTCMAETASKQNMKRTDMPFTSVRKRDGRIVTWEQSYITKAIYRAMQATGEGDVSRDPIRVSAGVVQELVKKFPATHVPAIEEIQDAVEESLILLDFPKTAKAYILYRSKRAEVREKRKLIPEHVQKLTQESKKYFRNALGEFIYYRTYSRWIDEENRRETWIETVDRYVNFMRENLGNGLKEEEYEEIRQAILRQEVMPSMRLMWSAGEAARKTNICAYNCSFIAPAKIGDFAEILYLLMCGTGVGFSVESQTVQKLPLIKKQTGKKLKTQAIEDSKEGWGNALTYGLRSWFSGKDIAFDFSKLRPAGARLRTMGGRSSGPEPLRALLEFSRARVLNRQGKRLTNIDVHDIICKIGEVVVMGGVRRSALISLSDLDDEEMRHGKDGQFYVNHPERAMANNSAVYNEKPDAQTFLEEWLALAKSGSGERGIFNRGGLKAQLPKRRWKVFAKDWATAGTNPCGEIVLKSKQFCVSADTPMVTKDAIVNIGEVANQKIEVWNGKQWSNVIPRKTREKQKLVRIYLGDGSYLDCTLDHRFSVKHRFQKQWQEVQAKDLMSYSKYTLQVEPTQIKYEGGAVVPDAYEMGLVAGDGHIYGGGVFIDLYGQSKQLLISGVRHKEYLPDGYNQTKVRVRTNLSPVVMAPLKSDPLALRTLASWNRHSILEFVAGMTDADGSVTPSGGVRLYVSEYERARTLQLLLTKCGIRSSVNLLHREGTQTNLGVRRHDLYYLQITDAREIPCKRVDTSHGHAAKFKGKYQTVKKIVELPGEHDVFCFNEQFEHKAVFANVLTYQCNLTEVVARPEDTTEKLVWKTKIATVLGTYQSSLTNFKYLSREWKKNCEEERLLGVSITGQWDCPAVRDPEVLRKMKEKAVETNREYAKKFGINPSTCTTCVKPSGTVSQLVDSSSGMHPRHAKYYIRRIRISATDPLFHMLKDQKFPYHPEVGQLEQSASTYVFEFPVKAPSGSIFKDDLSALQQLEYWKTVKENFTEHNPSVTVSVGENEWIDTANWLYQNWEILGGLSFLPRTNHVYKLAPYEDITEDQYKALATKMPDIDFSTIIAYEEDDQTQGWQELACVAGVCEIDYPSEVLSEKNTEAAPVSVAVEA